jgi:Zn-dependent peptidase ImmA (M78 family)
MTNAEIDSVANRLLEQHTLKQAPVDVFQLSKNLGIRVYEDKLPEDISGILDLRKTPLVLVNSDQNINRRRFSLAHEIGHFILHRPTGIHVDKQTYFRNANSSLGLETIEIEANRFAAELLMPSDLIGAELGKYTDLIDRDDDVLVPLAGKFQVSIMAMSFRIQNLGFHF